MVRPSGESCGSAMRCSRIIAAAVNGGAAARGERDRMGSGIEEPSGTIIITVAREAPMPRLASFEEFWPFYVSQHSRPSTRALHFAGTTMVLGSLAAGVLVAPWCALLAFVLGYG